MHLLLWKAALKISWLLALVGSIDRHRTGFMGSGIDSIKTPHAFLSMTDISVLTSAVNFCDLTCTRKHLLFYNVSDTIHFSISQPKW
jgi:hypothetical protein